MEYNIITSCDSLEDNYKRICDNVREASEKYRNGEKIRIMGVTKTVAPDIINRSIDLGIDLIGENRVQEYMSKKDAYKPCEVHFIGNLQTNKVKYIIDCVSMIQSVGSIKLAEEINKLAGRENKVMDILVQVNIGEEETKGGAAAENVDDMLYELEQYKNIRVRGLMTIPPPLCDENIFEQMHRLYEDMRSKHDAAGCFNTLSMGMSGDYGTAVKHGSTLIRLGTALYGARKYMEEK